MANKNFDVLIIGGSYAGLSAAMALGRSLRKVLVIDSGKPCNQQTPHSHNFITHDGATPASISEKAKAQVLKYDTVRFYNGIAVRGVNTGTGFEIATDKGDIFTSSKLIFATGITDQFPAIEGFAACWGISVVHCPYCHGYEYSHRKTALLANGDIAFHLGTLINNLTKDWMLLTNGKANLTPEQTDKLEKHNIGVIESELARIEHTNGYLQRIYFTDGTCTDLDVMYAKLPFVQHCDIPVSLGCELNEQGFLKVDPLQKTTVPGIYACGDNTNSMRSVANAVASGNLAGAAVNKELADEQF